MIVQGTENLQIRECGAFVKIEGDAGKQEKTQKAGKTDIKIEEND